MASFEVLGGHPLKGEIVPQGAKNEALQILCAVLLTSEPVTISNIPDIRDVNKLIELLRDMGVKVGKLASDTYLFQADAVNLDYLDTPEFVEQGRALRGSVMILGPMLARFGRCQLPKPGGDKIGRRPMDTHFLGLEKLGGKLTLEGLDFYRIKAENGLTGAYMMLDEASVTGTANIVMAAVLAKGTTTIYNAACEPYLQQLCKMLVRMGAKINGIGSNLLTIEGVTELGGTEHRMLPDMIEIGSFIGLAAMTGSEITIKDCQIAELGLIPDTFRKLGIQMEFRGDDIHIPAQEHYEIATYLDGSILTVSDHTWPGFTPDLLSIVLVVATQAKGTVLIHQKMFESRLFFVDKLIDMGAQVILCDPHRATVIGLDQQKQLHGITMTSPDIRAGVALLIAALSAEGRSVIENVEQIDRGYQYIDKRLNALGAQIRRL
ncbi:UDP-N-acetylglucosamine 1-carboxyvinyltransferase [Microvirga sp. STR05]|uniref:UDP-N-acetylglucosamine 1-carboxyvinyltransferase n=2 Tax=Hymenobacter TaxID=89966 RepID=A0A7G7W2U6_9BACT|nr:MULTISPECIES: UDP-N-acetylglucosamine 1-carboxyvinyltransferase [Hymenobacter]MBD2717050.1 UDP-N-acetylglucosamine 1-carboxyvinyltransferase [Hymenobacter duratus]MBR7951966.1 UDP-N-acetylglucosamine 1-carboxyvinyltransferase [Microvirga sp. STR05]QNH60689.1 UDP-N-acetylglucosamine 1-carboxyvinyltransferase [Hymenobacter sediminicola]